MKSPLLFDEDVLFPFLSSPSITHTSPTDDSDDEFHMISDMHDLDLQRSDPIPIRRCIVHSHPMVTPPFNTPVSPRSTFSNYMDSIIPSRQHMDRLRVSWSSPEMIDYGIMTE
jgi:hypothetical protein